MGTEAIWIPLALAAAGTGAQVYNTRQTAKREDNAAAAGIRQQAARQQQADQRVSQEVGAVERSTPEESRRAAASQFLNQLRQTQAQAIDGGAPGAVSGRYAGDAAGAEGDVAEFGRQTADTLARISAPGMQRQQESQGFGRLGNDLGQITNAANGDAFLQQLRQRAAGARNPWIDAAGQITTGLGSALATNEPGAARGPKKGTAAYNREYGLRG